MKEYLQCVVAYLQIDPIEEGESLEKLKNSTAIDNFMAKASSGSSAELHFSK